MDNLQVAELIEQIPDFLTPDEFLVALATKSAEVEREACASMLENRLKKTGGLMDDEGYRMGVEHSIAVIRARGEK